jgi:tetratricopeptide (TPR) repeat protein
MTSLRRNRTLDPSESNMNKSGGLNDNKSKKQPARSSFLKRFLTPRSSSANTSKSQSERTSSLSLTSIDIEDGSFSIDPQYINPRSNGLPLEVEIVKEEEQFGEDYFLGDEDDCDDKEDEDATGSTSTAAWRHYNTALAYAESELFDECLEQVSAGLESLQEQDVLYWTLTELRAQVWGRMGYTLESLTEYQGILAHCESDSNDNNNSSADQANLLYTCGKLSVSLNQFGAAVEYYRRELEITVQTAEGTGDNNCLAVARIYHELARVSVKGLGDSVQALGYYREALQVEMAVWKELSAATASCPLCRKTNYCASHVLHVQEVQQQIQDTKRSMGRIHFEQGDLDQAVRLM